MIRVVENQTYSPLVILTGAGASKACGLPDMRQFAKDFYTSMAGAVDTFDQELVCRLIYGLPSIKGNPEPKGDLEALLDGLTKLGEGLNGSDGAASLALSILAEMSGDLTDRLHSLVQKAEELVKKSREQTFYSGKIDLPSNLGGLASPEDLAGAAKVVSFPEARSRYSLDVNSIGVLGNPISYESELLRDTLKSAHSVAASRNKAVRGLSQKAEALAIRVKEKIRDAYSTPSLPYVQRAWGPMFEALKQFEGKNLDLFTLNYDPVIEMFCQSKNIPRVCGFVPEGQEFVWRNDFGFTQQTSYPCVRLYKIHGSVTWKGFERRIVDSPLFGPGTVRDLSGQPAKDMLIYPVIDKVFYGEPYFTLINHFRQALLSARCCLIIGFSYRDEMVVDLLRFACRENSAIKFIHCGMTRSKFQRIGHLSEILPRTEFTRYRFGNPKFSEEVKGILGRQLAI